MHIDFALILVLAALLTGLVWLLDVLVLRKRRLEHGVAGEPVLVEYARSFFPIILVVLVVRSFLYEPFRIPSSSMMPTLLVGDFIFVNKYTYGLRLPVINTKVIPVGDPQRGDVIVFRKPGEPNVNYIKRLVGLPGDRITYDAKRVYINGEPVQLEGLGDTLQIQCGRDSRDRPLYFAATTALERLGETEHRIYLSGKSDFPSRYLGQVVPDGHYFVMGDNRDCSQDSRIIGYIPAENLVGKAVRIWMNWDWGNESPRWERIGDPIH